MIVNNLHKDILDSGQDEEYNYEEKKSETQKSFEGLNFI